MRTTTSRRHLTATFVLGAAFLAGLESPVHAQHSNGCTKTLGQRSGSRTIVQEIPNSVLPASLQTSTSTGSPTASPGPGISAAQSSNTGVALGTIGGSSMGIQQGGGTPQIQNTRLNWRRMVGHYGALSRLQTDCPTGGKYQTTQILGEVGGPLHPYAHYFRALTAGKKGSAVPFVVAGMFGEDSYCSVGNSSAYCHFPDYRERQLDHDDYDDPPYTHDVGALYIPLNNPTDPFNGTVSGVTVRLMAAFHAGQWGLISAGNANSSAMVYVDYATRVRGHMYAHVEINSKSVTVSADADIHGVHVRGRSTVRNDDVILSEGSIEVKPTQWILKRLKRPNVYELLGPIFYAPGYTVPLFSNLTISQTAAIGTN